MKRMAIIVPSYRPVPDVKGGGVEHLVTRIINDNSEKGNYKIDLYTIFDEENVGKKIKNTKIIGIKKSQLERLFERIYNRILKLLKKEYIFDFYDKKVAKRINIKQYDYVVVENNMYLYKKVYNSTNNHHGVKFIFHLHNDIGNREKPINLCKFIDKTADRVLVCSEFLKRRFIKITGSNKVKILNNRIDYSIFKYNKQAGRQIRKKLGIDDDEIVLLYVGRMAKDKGISELLTFFDQNKQLIKMKKIKLLVVGDDNGSDRKTKKIFKKVVNSNNDVIYVGKIDNNVVYKYISASDAVIIPTIVEEAFGLVAIESLACSTPVIATNSGELAYHITNKTGYIFKKEYFAKELKKTISDLDAIKLHAIRDSLMKENKFDVYDAGRYTDIFMATIKADYESKKVIYTITFHRANNYGAMLQAFALQAFLEDRYDTRIVDYDNLSISNYYRLIIKGTRNIIKVVKHIIPRAINLMAEIKRENAFNDYRGKLKMTNYCNTSDEVEAVIDGCSAVVVGSDQIWNPGITGGYDDVYYLNINSNNAKKISYAASCGSVDKISGNYAIRRISNIASISVREKELKDYLDSKYICSTLVSDPTLLLSRTDWLKCIKKQRVIKEKYIFAYSVGNANELYYDTVNYLANKYGYKVIYFDKRCKKIHAKKQSMYVAGPNEFLNLLFYSELCVTTSFHGTALAAILNKKMFIILSTYSSRLTTLASSIGISDRIIKTTDDIASVDRERMEWGNINSMILSEASFSREWIIRAIEEDANE